LPSSPTCGPALCLLSKRDHYRRVLTANRQFCLCLHRPTVRRQPLHSHLRSHR
jgi:hypothetical protein